MAIYEEFISEFWKSLVIVNKSAYLLAEIITLLVIQFDELEVLADIGFDYLINDFTSNVWAFFKVDRRELAQMTVLQ